VTGRDSPYVNKRRDRDLGNLIEQNQNRSDTEPGRQAVPEVVKERLLDAMINFSGCCQEW